jgi:hypothetical protein
MHAFRLTLLLLSLSLASISQTTSSPSGNGKTSVVPAGDWGGEHIALTITAEGADFEFDCAMGHIKTPLLIDNHGHFSVKGLYKVERPAAAFVDDSNGSEVLYSGTLKGNTIHLDIAFPGRSDHMTFDLVRGQEPRLNKCA